MLAERGLRVELSVDIDGGRLILLLHKDEEENCGVDFKKPGQENDPSWETFR